jgi:hypothetical protein
MKAIFIFLIILIFVGCESPEGNPARYISFEEISMPYFLDRGAPEYVATAEFFTRTEVDWWYWSQGFEVSFVDDSTDDVNGWKELSSQKFPPVDNKNFRTDP